MARKDTKQAQQRDTELRHLVEEVGLLYERMGVPRMAGRILGWLLISEPAEQTMQELAESLDASMGSISTMTRLLEQQGLVERLSLPGERRVRYRLRHDAWLRGLEANVARLEQMRELGEKGIGILGNQPSPRTAALLGLLEFSDFFERELQSLIARYEEQNRGRRVG